MADTVTEPLKQTYRPLLYSSAPWQASDNAFLFMLLEAITFSTYSGGVHTSSNWSPYSSPAWWAMLPPVTLETKIPPFSPLTMEMPRGSTPLCTMTLRGSSKYGLVGKWSEYRWIAFQKSSYRIPRRSKLRGWGDVTVGLTKLFTALESYLLPRIFALVI